MNLQLQIDARLWRAVQRSYEDRQFANSISDCFYFLSDLIRNKSGCDSDGAALVNAAFGGDNPVVKINRFQTETERSEQRGMVQLLLGLYAAIRNPRSHEKRIDTAEAADAVILFIDFLIAMIDKSRSPFDTEQLIQRVFDQHFVASVQYADALTSTIPALKRGDVLSEVFRRRANGKIENTVLFTRSILAKVSDQATSAYWEMVSAGLEEADLEEEVRTAVCIASDDWGALSTLARLRTENRADSIDQRRRIQLQSQELPQGLSRRVRVRNRTTLHA